MTHSFPTRRACELEDDEVAPLNSYLRWLPCCYNPSQDRRNWFTQLMFAQHVANLSPAWGRSQGTGHPGNTFFNRGGGRSEEHTSELQSLMRLSYAVFCLKKQTYILYTSSPF